MNESWTFAGTPASIGTGPVTLVEGSTFCLSGPGGDIEPGTTQGLFVHDTRAVSTWRLYLDCQPLEPLTNMVHEAYRATFLAQPRSQQEHPDNTVLIKRDRYVGVGMREDLTVRNFGREATQCEISLEVDCDFADLFEVKKKRLIRGSGKQSIELHPGELIYSFVWRDQRRGVRIVADDASSAQGLFIFRILVPARGTWRTSVLVYPIINGQELPLPFPPDRPVEESVPAKQFSRWEAITPVVDAADPGLSRTLSRSRLDLGPLRIFGPDRSTATIAAGAPWFMTLFGRDSIIASLMALPVDPSLALGTLQTLARYQGKKVDPHTEEEPGRILHETRDGMETKFGVGGSIYYGTVDATPLFVLLLGELRQWGLAWQEVEELLPYADRALEWVERHGDRDGDGFVEYQRMTDRGLRNQGWKDSEDCINFANGRIAEPPIALCEVQGYVYAAYLARSHFAKEAGHERQAQVWYNKAAMLKKAFNECFWLPEHGWYAVGLDRDKQPIDALASNMGHCLWTGIVDKDKAPLVAERLMSSEMFNGWGIRTLASSMGSYNPVSYHNGSVWPHDNGIIAAGLMRYGFVEEAQRVASAILDAAEAFGGRLPELFCGFDRSECQQNPVPYPTSCSPQAWAAATPMHLLRVLLRLDPAVPEEKLWLDPALPAGMGNLSLTNVPLNGSRLSIHIRAGELHVAGLPDGVELVRAPRPTDISI
ncbi:MAG: amylo-alpha-1,6-glucosidase [Egibacteraceae bacterium]